jgi:hypothetical protein
VPFFGALSIDLTKQFTSKGRWLSLATLSQSVLGWRDPKRAGPLSLPKIPS